MGSFPSYRTRNFDGSRNVYCRKCFRLIASLSGGDKSFGSAICAICYAAETGEELSPEIQDALTNNMRMSSGFMAPRDAVLPSLAPPAKDPMGEDIQGFIGFWVKVIKAAVFGAVEGAKKEASNPLSKQVAKEKRRSRVFRIEDNNSTVVDDDRSISSSNV